MTEDPAANHPLKTAPDPEARLVPDWLGNLAALSWRVLVVVAFLVVLGLIAWSIWTITAAILLAIVVAAAFAPLVLRMTSRGRSRTAAAAIAWLAAIGTIGGLLLLVAIALVPNLIDLAQHVNDGADRLQSSLADIEVPASMSDAAGEYAEAARTAGSEAFDRIAASVADLAGILVLGTFLLFFFLRDGDKAWLWLFQSLGEAKRERITSAGDAALERLGGYLRSTAVSALFAAVTTYLFLVVLDVPLALTLALLTFGAAFVPYFGGLIAGAAVLLVTFAAHEGGATAVMFLLLAGRGLLSHYVIRPRLHMRTIELHPVIVLIALPAGFELGGVVGLFVAVPITALILTTAQAAVAVIAPDDPPPLPDLVPAWLDRAAQWSWRALVVLALIAVLVLVLTLVPLLVIPLILALIFAATLQPLVEGLVRRGQGRGVAAALAVGGSTVIIIGILALSVASLVTQAPELGDAAVAGAGEVDASAGGYLGLATDAVNEGARTTVSFILDVGGSLAALGTVVLLSVLLAFLFLRDGASLWAAIMSRTRSSARPELTAAADRSMGVLGGYMIGTGAISLVGAGSQLVIMWVLGLPLALPVFVLSFFGGYIPYIGSALTTLLAFFIAVAFGDTIDIIVMLIWTLGFNIVQGNVVAPLVYGRTAHIHPAIVLVAIPAGSAVAGILGMFIVVPALGVVAVSWRTVLAYLGGESDYVRRHSDEDAAPAGEADEPPGDVVAEPA